MPDLLIDQKNGSVVNMNKYNSGLAPLAIVLILVAVIVVGGGVYVATKSKTNVAVGTALPSASVSSSPTKTAISTTSTKPTTAPTKTAAPAPTGSTFASLQLAYDSERNLNCLGPEVDEKGPPTRKHYYITKAKIRSQTDQKDTDGQFKQWGGYYVFVPGVAIYFVEKTSSSFPPGDYHYDSFVSSMKTTGYYSTLTCTPWTVNASFFAGM